MGQQARKGPFRAKRARFPLVPPFRVRPAAVVSNYPPNLIVFTCRFGALHAVPLQPVQRYPPRLVSFCNSLAISMPHGAPARAQRRGSCGERTSSGVNEACRLRRAERYAACEDEVRRRWGSITLRT